MTNLKNNYSILLDTNAAVALSLFVDSCNFLNTNLNIELDEMRGKFLNEKGIIKDYLEFKEIQHGWIIFQYLKLKKDCHSGNVEIIFSLLSEYEIKKVFFECLYHREMIKRGLPYRLRIKKPFSIQFDFDYELDVETYWNKIKNKLNKYDISFSQPERNEGVMKDTIDKVSRIISKNLALSSQDLYLYSLAVFMRADEIYTFDGEFKTIINKMRTEIKCKSKKNMIIDDLKMYIPTINEEYLSLGKIELPEGKTINLPQLKELRRQNHFYDDKFVIFAPYM